MRLDEEFGQLDTLSPTERANRFPMLVGRLLERDGYQTKLDARGAAPRDADVIASSINDDLLIEVKSGARKVGLRDVAEVLDRLNRMPGNVIGLILSMAGFTKSAAEEVTRRRQHPVLLVDRDELADLFGGAITVRSLVRAKRNALTRDSKMPFFGGRSPLELPQPADRRALPAPNILLAPEPWTVTIGRGSEFVFVDELPDVDWTVALGSGAGIDVDLSVRSLDDLEGVFEVIRRGGWVTPAGRFSIHQLDLSWHGAGARPFLDAIAQQVARYAAFPSIPMHNEEQAVYADALEGGLYSLALRVLAGPAPQIFEAHLSIQLSGIPLDTSELRLVLAALGVGEVAAFRSLDGSQRVETGVGRPDQPLRVLSHVVAVDPLIEPGIPWISTVIVENPFRSPGAADQISPDIQMLLRGVDKLVCPLGSWYAADQSPRLHISRVDAVRTADVILLRPTANW